MWVLRRFWMPAYLQHFHVTVVDEKSLIQIVGAVKCREKKITLNIYVHLSRICILIIIYNAKVFCVQFLRINIIFVGKWVRGWGIGRSVDTFWLCEKYSHFVRFIRIIISECIFFENNLYKCLSIFLDFIFTVFPWLMSIFRIARSPQRLFRQCDIHSHCVPYYTQSRTVPANISYIISLIIYTSHPKERTHGQNVEKSYK